jgi:hypothetical protein
MTVRQDRIDERWRDAPVSVIEGPGLVVIDCRAKIVRLRPVAVPPAAEQGTGRSVYEHIDDGATAGASRAAMVGKWPAKPHGVSSERRGGIPLRRPMARGSRSTRTAPRFRVPFHEPAFSTGALHLPQPQPQAQRVGGRQGRGELHAGLLPTGVRQHRPGMVRI